jgi:hypothetical protein
LRYLLGVDLVRIYATSWKPKWSWFGGNLTVGISVEMKNDIRVNYFGGRISQGWKQFGMLTGTSKVQREKSDGERMG